MSGRPEITHGDRLLSPVELAEVLGVHPGTLTAWRRQGKGPPFFRLSKIRVRYRPGAVRQWLDEQTIN